jgi:tetratricopeptide (TPR) repeat protein
MGWLSRLGERLRGSRNVTVEAAPPAADPAPRAEVLESRITVEAAPSTADPSLRVEALESKANELKQRGDLAGAIACLDEALQLLPDSALHFYQRGVIRCMNRQYSEAIADLDRALELRPRFAAAITERGLAYLESGDPSRALHDYDAGLRIDPAYVTAIENKGCALLIMKRPAEAVQMFSRALRFHRGSILSRYNRGMAYILLEENEKAQLDLEVVVSDGGESQFRPQAELWLEPLRDQPGEAPRPSPLADFLWPEHITLSLEQRVSEVVAAVQQHEACQIVLPLAPGGHAVLSVYKTGGLRERLTEIADLIGEEILTLELGQLLDALSPCTAIAPDSTLENAAKAALASGGQTLVIEQGQIRCVLAAPAVYNYPAGPTALFADPPDFGRNREGATGQDQSPSNPAAKAESRRCTGCAREVAYYRPVLIDNRLHGLACPHCGADPVLPWIEQRMRPGHWSRAGFLDETERVHDVIERDALRVEAMGLTHAQLADSLGTLLELASQRAKDRIFDAQLASMKEMARAGKSGHDGLAIVPISPTFEDVLRVLERGALPPEDQGVIVGDLQLFLQVYLGYQSCPWTILRRPYCPKEAPWKMMEIKDPSFRAFSPLLGEDLPCADGVTFPHGDRDFLLVNRRTRKHIQGAGMMPHLIREHRFFEGQSSAYRLDPEELAQVLGPGR